MYLEYINQTYPIRRTKEEKKSFQNYVLEAVKEAKVETTNDGKNEKRIVVYTVHSYAEGCGCR